MRKKCARVAWSIKSTGASGHGEWIDEELAKAWVAWLNKHLSATMNHWIEYQEVLSDARLPEPERKT
jgi:hypothetical protein